MNGFFLKYVRGPVILILTVTALLYGWFLLSALPLWSELKAAAGGRELQESPLYGPARVAEVLAAYTPETFQTARIFLALDLIYAIVLAVALAGLIAFALRRIGWEARIWRCAIVAPLAAGAFDLIEDGLLALFYAQHPASPGLLAYVAGAATALKLIAFLLSALAAIVLLVIAGAVHARRQLEEPGATQ
ncbi:MAG: hypothetical protein GC206_00575 [Alphaproteobacteria bacterium]|nr:hypothetical protein [Alphaproteobacteria bacterium]